MSEKESYSKRNIISDATTNYLERKFKPLNQELWRMRLDSENKYVPIIQRDVESLMIVLLDILQPNRILEIGTAKGYSMLVMANKAPNARIVSLEKNILMAQEANENIKAADLTKRADVIRGDAKKTLFELQKKVKSGVEKPFDFVFIDASKSHYKEFWDIIVEMVSDKAFIMCDNIFMRGMTIDDAYDVNDKHRTNIRKMREFLDYITAIEDIDTAILPVGDGVSISYIRGK